MFGWEIWERVWKGKEKEKSYVKCELQPQICSFTTYKKMEGMNKLKSDYNPLKKNTPKSTNYKEHMPKKIKKEKKKTCIAHMGKHT